MPLILKKDKCRDVEMIDIMWNEVLEGFINKVKLLFCAVTHCRHEIESA